MSTFWTTIRGGWRRAPRTVRLAVLVFVGLPIVAGLLTGSWAAVFWTVGPSWAAAWFGLQLTWTRGISRAALAKWLELWEAEGALLDEILARHPEIQDELASPALTRRVRSLASMVQTGAADRIGTVRTMITEAANARRRELRLTKEQRALALRNEGRTIPQIVAAMQDEGLIRPDALDPERQVLRWLQGAKERRQS